MSDTRAEATRCRRRVRLTGAVCRVRATGRGGRPALRAELNVGEAPVTVIWLGRTQIPGVEPGRRLAVEGRLSEHRGRRVIYNPRYDLGQDPP